jgi:hypothetical protein
MVEEVKIEEEFKRQKDRRPIFEVEIYDPIDARSSTVSGLWRLDFGRRLRSIECHYVCWKMLELVGKSPNHSGIEFWVDFTDVDERWVYYGIVSGVESSGWRVYRKEREKKCKCEEN